MAKRLSSGQANTLFNYFQSPKSKQQKLKELNAGSSTEDEKPKNNESDDEEVIKQPKKKRNRILLADSDSDSENIESNENAIKKVKVEDRTDTPKALKKFSFDKTTPKKEPKKQTDDHIIQSAIKASKKLDEDSKWVHEKLPFLKPENIKDGKKRKPDHPEYDPHTLHVPEDYLNSLTPAMRQWWVLKSKHFDCVLFFKVGKFYELYHMDATVGVDYLGFSYMRGEFAHSGFPESAYGRMAGSLIEQGFKVARVEQTETPEMMTDRCKSTGRATKFDKVVKREICQISTKGTCIYGAQLTEAKHALPTYMIAIAEKVVDNNTRFGICFIDTSIGIFNLAEFPDDKYCSRLLTLLAQHPPALVLTEKNRLSAETNELLKKALGNVKRDLLNPESQFFSAETTIKKLISECYFKDSNDEVQWPLVLKDLIFDGCPKKECELMLKSFGACMWYLKDSEIDIHVISMGKFEIYQPVDTLKKSEQIKRDYMVLDSVTMSNLKILGGLGSLQKNLDYCCTPFGKRLLQQWICRPLCDIAKIEERQKAIGELLNNVDLLRTTRELFSKLPDLERQIAKIHIFGNRFCAKNHPDSRAVLYEAKTYSSRKIMDLLSTLQAFERATQIPSMFKGCESRLLRKLTQSAPNGMFLDLTETLDFFKGAFDHKKAKEDGTIIPQKGIEKDYDEVTDEIQEVQDELDEYLKEQCKFFKCEVTYFGNDKKRFQLEIPESKCHKVPHEYQLEGTKKGSKPAKRYSTSTTKELLAKMMRVEANRSKILLDLNRKIFERFSRKYEEWEQVLQCLVILDCLCSLAEYARVYSEDICVPKLHPFTDNPICNIQNGRHPCITNVDNFVPNDTEIGTEEHPAILILTGPNMGGKSTLMRQVVLISIMAQIGSYVPASYCELSLIDRIFTRLGAHDDILKNQSTFLVELMEASSILQHATRNSFLLLDELGRGTSTHDGNAIATAYVRKLCEINCRTMFSTHYHTLVEYFHGRNDIQLGYMVCMVENDGDINKERVTFLYKIAEGICPKSYGFNVAKLAGLPPAIVNLATKKAAALEAVDKNRDLFKRIFRGSIADARKILLEVK